MKRKVSIQSKSTKKGWNTWRMKIRMPNIWNMAPIARGEGERGASLSDGPAQTSKS